MNVRCDQCETVYRVDPAKVPAQGVRARCAVCSNVLPVGAEPVGAEPAAPATLPAPPAPPAVPAVPEAPAAPTQTPAAATPARPAPPPRHPRPTRPLGPTARPAAPQAASRPRQTPSPPAVPPAQAAGTPAAQPRSPRPSAPVFRPIPGKPVTPPPVSPPAPSAPTPAPAPALPAGGGERRVINPFQAQDPRQKARRLARALVSDIIVYQPEKRQQALAAGNLKQAFGEEIKKSWEEYVLQVGEELANNTNFFNDALNEILAGGQKVF